MKRFYSNGKLLLSGEYLVLDGAKALAIPTKLGQDLQVNTIDEPVVIWESFDVDKNVWFQAEFRFPDLRIQNETFETDTENAKESIAQTLQNIMVTAKSLNSEFLTRAKGFHVQTYLGFPRNWGLGTSSTLINNIAQWANVDAFELLEKSFGGSGYDIACARHDLPIVYRKEKGKSLVEEVRFDPPFSEQLYFVFLNVKQDSKKGIQRYKEFKGNNSEAIQEVNRITDAMTSCTKLSDFEELVKQHESIISKMINTKPVQDLIFPDYFGQVKSLGAWGGDFVLATGNKETPNYFKQKGFGTVIPFNKMILR